MDLVESHSKMLHPVVQHGFLLLVLLTFQEVLGLRVDVIRVLRLYVDQLHQLVEGDVHDELFLRLGKLLVGYLLVPIFPLPWRVIHFVELAALCQPIVNADIGEKEEIEKWAKKLGAKVFSAKLESQFRCNGSDGYLSWLDNSLQINETANTSLEGIKYDFKVLDSPNAVRDMIFEKNKANNKARLVAGYCWDWVSKKNKDLKDINILEHKFEMTWNLASDGNVWIISPNSVNEAGCIHTCQGLEVDYIGVIVGPDMIARNNKIITVPKKRAKQTLPSTDMGKPLLKIQQQQRKRRI